MKKELRTLLFGVMISVLLFIAACGAEQTTQIVDEADEIVKETEEMPTEEVAVETTEEMPAQETEAEETVVETQEETAAETTDYETISVEGCTDSDGGMNYNTAGSVTDIDGIEDTDKCSTNENYSGRLYELYCQESGKYGRETYDCPSGSCMSGACALAESAEE